MIDLSLGEVRITLPPVPAVVSARPTYGDPAGLPALRRHLAASLRVAPDAVCVTTGASLGLAATLASRRPSLVLLPDLRYPGYVSLLRALGIEFLTYRALTPSGIADAGAAVAALQAHPGATLLWNFPHNPTGTLDTPEDRAAVARAAMETGGELVTDCVYAELAYSAFEPPVGAPNPGEVRVNSLSKSLALAGERVGYVVAAPDRLREITASHWALAMSPPSASQEVALAALEDHPQRTQAIRSELESLRSVACRALYELPNVKFTPPGGGLFIWFDVPTLDTAVGTLSELLERSGVRVTPGTAFGSTATAARLSFAVPRAELDRGLSTLASLLTHPAVPYVPATR